MKKNMKKLASFLFMAMLVLGLTACGGSKEPVETVVDSAYAQQVSDFLIANVAGMSAEEMQYYVTMDAEDLQVVLDQSGVPVMAEAFQSVFNGYSSDVETFGEYVSTDSYELKGDDEEATHTTKLTFTGHPASLMLVFDEDGVVISATLDPVLSTGEILEKAGLNTVIGMGTVFVVLIFISCIIALLPKFTGLLTGFGKKKPVDVVIRPEDIDIVEPDAGHLVGTVTSVTFKGLNYDIIVEFKGFKWLIQTTDFHAEGSTIGIRLNPEDIHIMKKSEYSGMFGDYSSYSAEYDELTEDADDEEE